MQNKKITFLLYKILKMEFCVLSNLKPNLKLKIWLSSMPSYKSTYFNEQKNISETSCQSSVSQTVTGCYKPSKGDNSAPQYIPCIVFVRKTHSDFFLLFKCTTFLKHLTFHQPATQWLPVINYQRLVVNSAPLYISMYFFHSKTSSWFFSFI